MLLDRAVLVNLFSRSNSQNKREKVGVTLWENLTGQTLNHSGAADIKIQPKSPKFLLDMRCFCNFSLVSLGTRSRSRQCAERTRQGEWRWSRPLKAALERSYSTENSSSANRMLGPGQKKTPDQIHETKEWFYIYV